jgi:GntR family transcriptional regulator of arabinose operon
MLDRSSNAPHLHMQVAGMLKDRIRSGIWPDRTAIPSEKELCAEFDVARGTIRQALQTLESEGYLIREQGRGTFVHLAEVNQVALRSKRLAFVVPYVRDSSIPTMLVGFQQVAEEAGFSVIFNHVNNDQSQQERAIVKLIDEHIAGIGLYPVSSEEISLVERLKESGFPIVLIDRYLRSLSTDYVMTDHFSGIIRGTQYLLDLGHRRVGFVTWLSPAVSMEHRFLGYRQALSERQIPFDERLVCRVEGYPVIDLTPLQQYLSGEDRPSAIVAANDQIAIGLYRAAASLSLRIPEDLSIIGFDNLDVSSHLDPPLTTIAQPFLTIGQVAANCLLRRIRGEQSYYEQVTLQPELVIRDSCRAFRLNG